VPFPLTPADALALADVSSNPNDAESPVDYRDTANNIVITPMGFGSVPAPTFPQSEGAAGDAFWAEFNEVVQLQKLRKENPGRSIADFIDVPALFLANGWTTLATASAAVRSDFPTHFPTLMVGKLLSRDCNARPDCRDTDPTCCVTFRTDVTPKRSGSDFVRNQVLLARLIGWAVSEVSDSAFATKWYYGRPRPEEVAMAVKGGDYGACTRVPDAMKSTLAAPGFGMGAAADFTAYDTPGSGGTKDDCTMTSCGSPRHPSFPAMHSAASAASLYLPLVLKLNTAQITELRKLDFAVATSRTFAGVHYPTDNRAGLNVGQEVLAKQLPGFFADQFGGSSKGKETLRAKVEAELAALSYDWRDHQACTGAQCSSQAEAFPL